MSDLTRMFGHLSNGSKLSMLEALATSRSPITTTYLAAITGLNMNTASQQLNRMWRDGLVTRMRHSNSTLWMIDREAIREIKVFLEGLSDAQA